MQMRNFSERTSSRIDMISNIVGTAGGAALGALGLHLAFGIPGLPEIGVPYIEALAPDNGTCVTEELPADMQREVDEGIRFWESQGTDMSPVEIIYISNPEPCTVEGIDAPFNGPRYLPAADKVIIQPTPVLTESGGMDFAIAHELGHAEQDQNGVTHRNTTVHELQADCLAGAETAASDDDNQVTTNQIQVLYLTRITADQTHGTGFQRLDAFDHGVQGGDCSWERLSTVVGPLATGEMEYHTQNS